MQVVNLVMIGTLGTVTLWVWWKVTWSWPPSLLHFAILSAREEQQCTRRQQQSKAYSELELNSTDGDPVRWTLQQLQLWVSPNFLSSIVQGMLISSIILWGSTRTHPFLLCLWMILLWDVKWVNSFLRFIARNVRMGAIGCNSDVSINVWQG